MMITDTAIRSRLLVNYHSDDQNLRQGLKHREAQTVHAMTDFSAH